MVDDVISGGYEHRLSEMWLLINGCKHQRITITAKTDLGDGCKVHCCGADGMSA